MIMTNALDACVVLFYSVGAVSYTHLTASINSYVLNQVFNFMVWDNIFYKGSLASRTQCVFMYIFFSEKGVS